MANKIGSFSIASLNAASNKSLDFSMAAHWNITRQEMDKLQDQHGVHLHHIDLVRSPLSLQNIAAYKQLVKLIRDENIDYIHCNTPVGGILGRLAGKKCKVKRVIYQAHGFHFYKGAPKLNWLLYYPVEKWLAHYTDALITINQEDYELAKKKFKLRNGGKVYYVPGVGIDVAQFAPEGKAPIEKRIELGIPQDAFVLISVGELNKNKNNRVIISAMEKLGQVNIHYVLCGVGDQEESLRQQAHAAGLHNRVHFLGFRKDVKELYKMSDCFVMPSQREGLSRSIMEAMASGLPCIASRIRGNTDLLDGTDGGFLCNTMDVSAYAEKIKLLAGDAELRKRMGRNNLQTIEKFSTETVTDEIRRIYDTEFRE